MMFQDRIRIKILLLPSVQHTLVTATTQPSLGDGDEYPNPPAPTSVQADDIIDEEIDTVLRSVLESDGSRTAPEPEPVIQKVVAPAGDEMRIFKISFVQALVKERNHRYQPSS